MYFCTRFDPRVNVKKVFLDTNILLEVIFTKHFRTYTKIPVYLPDEMLDILLSNTQPNGKADG